MTSRGRETLYPGKRDVLVEALTQAILRGEYSAGERLRQDEIAERFGVSPTPVREALRILEAQGLVLHEAHRGVSVADLAGTAQDFYRLREVLECLAAEMAVQNMGPSSATRIAAAVADMEAAAAAGDSDALTDAHRRFHLGLYQTSGFTTLVDLIQMVWSRFPWDALLSLPERRPVSIDDHRAIAELAERGDVAGTVSRLRDHLTALGQRLRDGVAITKQEDSDD